MEILKIILAVILIILLLFFLLTALYSFAKYATINICHSVKMNRAKTIKQKLDLITKWECRTNAHRLSVLKNDVFNTFRKMIREFPEGPKSIEIIEDENDTRFPLLYLFEIYDKQPPYIKCGKKYLDILKNTLEKEGLTVEGNVTINGKIKYLIYNPS